MFPRILNVLKYLYGNRCRWIVRLTMINSPYVERIWNMKAFYENNSSCMYVPVGEKLNITYWKRWYLKWVEYNYSKIFRWGNCDEMLFLDFSFYRPSIYYKTFAIEVIIMNARIVSSHIVYSFIRDFYPWMAL